MTDKPKAFRLKKTKYCVTPEVKIGSHWFDGRDLIGRMGKKDFQKMCQLVGAYNLALEEKRYRQFLLEVEEVEETKVCYSPISFKI